MRNASLKTKILGLSLGLVALVTLVGGLNFVLIRSVVGEFRNILDTHVVSMQMLDEMRFQSEQAARLYIRMVLPENSAGDIKKAADSYQKAIDAYLDSEKRYVALQLDSEERGLYNQLKDAYDAWIPHANEVVRLVSTGSPEDHKAAFKLVMTTTSEKRREVVGMLNKLNDLQDKSAQAQEQHALTSELQGNILSIVLLSVGSVIGLIASFFFASVLSKTLRGITGNIADSSLQLNSASEQLSVAGEQLSSGTTESAASLAETVASVEELSSMVKLNADHAREAASLSIASRSAAEEGATQMNQLNSAMNEIAQSSKKIEEIINVIDDIAFQTNLLALNAAVEAARAGEQGRGFAVVADAVRSLAQRSAAAAKDIGNLIKETVGRIDHGSAKANEGAQALGSIVTSVKKVAELNNEIAAASQEQSIGLTNITKAMNELDRSTQQNAASAEETAAASTELSSQSMVLSEMVEQLNLMVDGASRLQNSASETIEDKVVKPQIKLVASRGNLVKESAANATREPRAKDIIKLKDTSGF